jgi:hypothetical protein
MGCFRTHTAALEVPTIGYSEYSNWVQRVPPLGTRSTHCECSEYLLAGVDCLAFTYIRSGFAGHTGYSEYAPEALACVHARV